MYKCVAILEDGEKEKTGTVEECCRWADEMALEEGTVKIELERVDDGRKEAV